MLHSVKCTLYTIQCIQSNVNLNLYILKNNKKNSEIVGIVSVSKFDKNAMFLCKIKIKCYFKNL